MIRILRAADHKSMPWKNGGGVTTEIAIHPEGADLAAFDWRVSMADVASDGPFSMFTGIDRTLAVLEGEGIGLTIDGRDPVVLMRESDPLPFPADAVTYGALTGGPILDLNVMTRRGRLSATVERRRASGAFDLDPDGDWTLLLVNRGRLYVHSGELVDDLAARDCLLIEGKCGPISCRASDPAELYLIRMTPEERESSS